MSQPPNTTLLNDASGMKSLMSGERPSVRLPRQTVPICVSDPVGGARPRRTASTPAMVVVLTAPIPTRRMPSFPVAASIFGGFFTTENYIIENSMAWWLRKSTGESLSVSMAGVKLGDRLLVIGCSDPMLIAQLASKTGLTGRAAAVDARETAVAAAADVAAREGALLETFTAPWNALPLDGDTFDVVIIRDVLPYVDAAKRAWCLV